MRDYRHEKIRLRSRLRTLRGFIRQYRSQIESDRGCGGCKGNALKLALRQYDGLQRRYVELVSEEKAAVQ